MKNLRDFIEQFSSAEEFNTLNFEVNCPVCTKLMNKGMGPTLDDIVKFFHNCPRCGLLIIRFGNVILDDHYRLKWNNRSVRVWCHNSKGSFISDCRAEFMEKRGAVQFTNGYLFSYCTIDLDGIPTYVDDYLLSEKFYSMLMIIC